MADKLDALRYSSTKFHTYYKYLCDFCQKNTAIADQFTTCKKCYQDFCQECFKQFLPNSDYYYYEKCMECSFKKSKWRYYIQALTTKVSENYIRTGLYLSDIYIPEEVFINIISFLRDEIYLISLK